MNYKEYLENFDKSDSNDWYRLEGLCQVFYLKEMDFWGSDIDGKVTARIKKYWQTSWICTDTKVGTAVYTFDDKPFAISHQKARKWDEQFQFTSMEDALDVVFFLKSLIVTDTDQVKLIDMDAEVPQINN